MTDDQQRAITNGKQLKNSADENVSVPAPEINWFRFWMRMLVAAFVFNVIAGLITWLFIFPHLHRAG